MVKVRLVEQYSKKIISSRTFEYREKGLEGNVKGAIKGYDMLIKTYLQALSQWLKEEHK